MKKKIGVKLGITFAVLFSFLFASPTQQYQVEAAKTKTEKKASIKRTANKKVTVKVKKYIDGDRTRFKLKNGKTVTAKYLLITAPELKKENPYAQEAKERTKELLKNAEKIQIEYDKGAKRDSKKRELVYVWADGELVQETLASEGLAMMTSTKGKNTKYLDKIKKAEKQAKDQKRNIWSIENYAQGDKGYSQAAADEYKKAQSEALAAKKRKKNGCKRNRLQKKRRKSKPQNKRKRLEKRNRNDSLRKPKQPRKPRRNVLPKRQLLNKQPHRRKQRQKRKPSSKHKRRKPHRGRPSMSLQPVVNTTPINAAMALTRLPH